MNSIKKCPGSVTLLFFSMGCAPCSDLGPTSQTVFYGQTLRCFQSEAGCVMNTWAECNTIGSGGDYGKLGMLPHLMREAALQLQDGSVGK